MDENTTELGSDADREQRIARVLPRARQLAAVPVLDPRTPDEIIGLNQHGVPA
jgi:hypothetical protein